MTKQEFFTRLNEMGRAGAVTQEAVRYLAMRKNLDEINDSFLRLAFKVMESERTRLNHVTSSTNIEEPLGFMQMIADIERQVTSRWVELMGEVRLQQDKGVYKANRSSSEYIRTRDRLAKAYPFPKALDRLNTSQMQSYRDSKRVWLHTLDLVADLELERIELAGA